MSIIISDILQVLDTKIGDLLDPDVTQEIIERVHLRECDFLVSYYEEVFFAVRNRKFSDGSLKLLPVEQWHLPPPGNNTDCLVLPDFTKKYLVGIRFLDVERTVEKTEYTSCSEAFMDELEFLNRLSPGTYSGMYREMTKDYKRVFGHG